MNCSNTRLLLNNLECEEWEEWEEWVVRSVERWSMWNWTWTWSDDDWYNFKYFNISYYFHVHSDPFMFVCWCNSKASLRKYYKFISKQGNGEGWGVKEAHKNVTMPAKSKTTKQYENENSSKTKSKWGTAHSLQSVQPFIPATYVKIFMGFYRRPFQSHPITLDSHSHPYAKYSK